MARIDPTLALFDVKTMEERKELSFSSRRTAMSLALGFGGWALCSSAVGILQRALLSFGPTATGCECDTAQYGHHKRRSPLIRWPS